MGVKVFGGCCGTTPEYIALLSKELEGKTVKAVPRHVPAAGVQRHPGGAH